MDLVQPRPMIALWNWCKKGGALATKSTHQITYFNERDVFNSMKYIDFHEIVDVYGIGIPTDKEIQRNIMLITMLLVSLIFSMV